MTMFRTRCSLLSPFYRVLAARRSRHGDLPRLVARSAVTSAAAARAPLLGRTARTILVVAFTSAISYTVAVWDVTSRLDRFPKSLQQRSLQYGNAADLRKALEAIQELVGEERVTQDEADRHQHGFSDWSTVNAQQLPAAVVYPESTDEVSKIVTICSRHRIPMVPFSGGSSLEANFAAPYGGVTLDFSLMDSIVAFHPEDLDVIVQPGMPWMSLNEQIKDSGLFFPVDPGPSAQIGGMIGTCCSGTNAVRYGPMRLWVINVTVVLADGRIVKTRQRPRKTAAGYDLTGLIVGAEGTLGIVTEATLRLAVRPEVTNVGIVTFDSIRSAASAASGILRAGVPIAAVEIMDDVQMRVINQAGATGRYWKEVPTLMLKFSGTKITTRDNFTTVEAIVRRHGGADIQFAESEEAAEKLWAARKSALWSMLSLRTSGKEVCSTDVAVPLSRLADIIEITKDELDNLNLFASVLGHVGDSNFHTSILYDREKTAEREAVDRCVHDMVSRALEMEGTCAGEHGIGMGKKQHLIEELGDAVDMMKTVKQALDPYWLMNPGKIFDADEPPRLKEP